MMMKRISFLLLVLIVFSISALAHIPRVINYQGRLLGSNEQPVAEGNYKITFRLYDEASTLLWTEVHNQVLVTGGLFHVILGTVVPLNLSFDQPYFLGIQVGNDPELQPRMYLTSAPYSFNADRVAGISVSAVPAPGVLFPLGENGKFPSDVLPSDVAGNYLKKNEPDISKGTGSDPMLLISNQGDGDGINGRGIDGRGVVGRSDNDFGVVGWTGAESSDKSGVMGHSQNGSGVSGNSDASSGVVGWTNSSNSSGVFGFSDHGNGVTGRSGGNDGLLGVTTSGEPGDAGLRARNEGGGPAIFCEGDLYVTGAIRGNLGSTGEGAAFPRPAYDSGWIPIPQGGVEQTGIKLTHNLGGNVDNYVVDLQFRHIDPVAGISYVHHHGYGGNTREPGRCPGSCDERGAYWTWLTDTDIIVRRYCYEPYVQQVRVRIWVYK